MTHPILRTPVSTETLIRRVLLRTLLRSATFKEPSRKVLLPDPLGVHPKDVLYPWVLFGGSGHLARFGPFTLSFSNVTLFIQSNYCNANLM